MKTKPWTTAEIKTCKALWATKITTREIATHLPGRTRHAVCGLLHRAGLMTKKPPKPYVARTKARAMPVVRDFTKDRGKPPALRMVPVVKLRPVEPSADGHVTFHELMPGMCKFPIGDGAPASLKFCGASEGQRKPYCEFHADMCYNGTTYRKTDKSIGVIRMPLMGGLSR